MKITDNTFVAIDYRLTLDSGEEVDRSSADRPLTFITGSGQIIPGLEKNLMGLKQGDTARITVEPEDGYGVVKEDLLQEIPRARFPADLEIQPGMAFEAQGPHGPFTFYVRSLNDETVTADLNHPMAGKRLHFEVNIAEVREPSVDELAATADSGCGCGCGSGGSADADDCGCGSGSADSGGCGSGCNCG